MQKIFFVAIYFAMISTILLTQFGCTSQQKEEKVLTKAEMVERGKYLVDFGGCNDCHTSKIFTDMGPQFDTTRLLAGHFSDQPLPEIDTKMVQPGKWMLANSHLTAWVGPWGMSYSANLTPDKATGIGALSEEMFIKTLREGKMMGVGRPILPPMPWQGIGGTLTDEDLKCIYTYLMSIKPINNKVPEPTPPDKLGSSMAAK